MKRLPCERDYLRYAFRLAKMLKSPETRINALGLVIRYYATVGESDKIPDIFNDVFKIVRGIKNASRKIWPLTSIADAYRGIGQTLKARQTLSKAYKLTKAIKNDFQRDFDFEKLAIEYAQISEYSKAFQVINRLKNKLRKEWALTAIAGVYIKNGRDKQAFQLIKVVEKCMSRESRLLNKIFGSFHVKDAVLKTIAASYAEIGKLNRALQAAKAIKDSFYKAEAFKTTAQEYINDGKNKKACVILSRALQLIETDKLEYLDTPELLEIAKEYARAGQKDKALKIANRIYKAIKKMKPDSKKSYIHNWGDWRHSLLAKLACIYTICGRFQIAKKISLKWYRYELFLENVPKYAKLRQYDKVIKLAKNIDYPYWKVWALEKILDEYIKEIKNQ